MANGNNRNKYRFALLLLVVLALVPVIFILGVAAFAKLKGCQTGQGFPCEIVSGVSGARVSALIDSALALAAGLAGASNWSFFAFCAAFLGWLTSCYLLLLMGWSSLSSRLALGFAVLVSAFASFVWPGLVWSILAFANLAKNCDPNVSKCEIFGEEIKHAYSGATLVESSLLNVCTWLAVASFGVFSAWAVLQKIRTQP
jgi:uncharacterized membrane protein YeaQ/YmgE (transglycosylase-associated protein family)